MTSTPLSLHPDCNPECRACHYRELSYEEQLARKNAWAASQLGRWKSILAPIEAAPEKERLGYRFKSWLRSSVEKDECGLSVSFGMLRSRQRDGEWEKEFISWNRCPLHAEPIREMIARLRTVLPENAADFTESSLAGVWFGSPHLVIVARDEKGLERMRAIDWARVLAAPYDRAWFHVNTQIGAKVFGHRELVQLLGPANDPAHPVRAFRQTAHSLLTRARELALEHLLQPLTGVTPVQVLDLFCGTGELSLGLPAEIDWIGIEQSRDAVKFAASLKKPGRAVHEAFVGAVEQRLSDPQVLGLIRAHYSLYLNPPRSGLTPEARARVIELIEAQRPGRITYLSCSASSLSRDLAALEGAGYRVEALRPFDFFPQTEHFETLALLSATFAH